MPTDWKPSPELEARVDELLDLPPEAFREVPLTLPEALAVVDTLRPGFWSEMGLAASARGKGLAQALIKGNLAVEHVVNSCTTFVYEEWWGQLEEGMGERLEVTEEEAQAIAYYSKGLPHWKDMAQAEMKLKDELLAMDPEGAVIWKDGLDFTLNVKDDLVAVYGWKSGRFNRRNIQELTARIGQFRDALDAQVDLMQWWEVAHGPRRVPTTPDNYRGNLDADWSKVRDFLSTTPAMAKFIAFLEDTDPRVWPGYPSEHGFQEFPDTTRR
jgi:hypothetical protein